MRLRLVVEHSLAPFCGPAALDRLELQGPDIDIVYGVIVGLCLVLHELATNAAKYGALAAEAGQVAIAWSVVGERLELSWIERGGPSVEAPERRGFGSTLIERIVTRSLEGSFHVEYVASGLEARLSLPLRSRA